MQVLPNKISHTNFFLSLDRAVTEEGAQICELSQNKLMEALQYLLAKNHPGDLTILPRMLMILTDLRSMERNRGEELAKMCMLNITQNFSPALVQWLNLNANE